MRRFAAWVVVLAACSASAGPELSLREFAGGQVKKGVRTIGMGGDGATTGNYALVYKDQGGAIFDEGVTRFLDSRNTFTFTAVGFTTPTFWNDAAFYVIALGQTGTGIRVWDQTTASASKPPSTANLADTSLFVKFAKPLTPTLSVGVMLAYDQSQATLLPDSGAAPIRYVTSWLPSGGAGLHWHPDEHWQVGARVILNHDWETRAQGGAIATGFARSYEYRLGVAFSPWAGTLFDAGASALDRSNGLEKSSSFVLNPTLGVEQVLLAKRLWLRAGLDETTWTAGGSVAFGFFKLDLAVLYNLGQARIGDVFGKESLSVIATLGFDYQKALEPR
jgi:hypothetical protein